MSSPPKVLVILASYNGAAWLQEQLDSIHAQENVETVLLIGDDGSSDGSRMLLDAAAAGRNIRVVFWERPSGSAGANFRRLYREADLYSVDYVALADQDDVWHSHKLSNAITALRENEAQGYSCAVRSFWPDGTGKVLAQCPVTRTGDFLFEGGGQGCTFVVTAALFRRVKDFCVDQFALCEQFHYHDWLIYLLARTWSMPWHFDQQPWMAYRQHSGNEIGSRGNLQAISKRLALIKNGWYRKQVTQAIALCRRAGGMAVANELSVLLEAPPGLLRRVRMAHFILSNGRRKFSDRAVLGFSALAGWL